MSTAVLLMKLIEVERALQSGNIYGAHRLVLESEECVLKLDREMIQVQTDKARQAVPNRIVSDGESSEGSKSAQSPLDMNRLRAQMEKFSVSARRLGRVEVVREEARSPLAEMAFGAES